MLSRSSKTARITGIVAVFLGLVMIVSACSAPRSPIKTWHGVLIKTEHGIRMSDPGVTPANLSFHGVDTYEPDDTSATARLLRLGAAPEDHTLHSRQDEDWYYVRDSDGPGYLRIGATGPIGVDGHGQQGPGDDHPAPGSGATLVQIIDVLPYDGRINSGRKGYHYRVRNLSNNPIAYRVSAVSELPLSEVGVPTAQIAAEHYVSAISEGNSRDFFEMTRSHVSTRRISALRQALFGRTEPFFLANEYGSPGFGYSEKYENRPVQRMIWATEGNQSAYALEVTCKKEDGLWLAVAARLDPSVSKTKVAAIIKKAVEDGRWSSDGNW